MNITGGEKAIYLASNILRLDWVKDIGGTKSSALNFGDGVEGFLSKAIHAKSKTNGFGSYTNLVYLNECGYDPMCSTLYEAMTVGDIASKGNNYYLDKYPDLKFNIKTYKDIFQNNFELIPAFYDQMKYKCQKYLSSGEDLAKVNERLTKELLDAPDANLDFSKMKETDVNELDDMYSEIYRNII